MAVACGPPERLNKRSFQPRCATRIAKQAGLVECAGIGSVARILDLASDAFHGSHPEPVKLVDTHVLLCVRSDDGRLTRARREPLTADRILSVTEAA